MKKSIFMRVALVMLVVTMACATLFAGNTALAKYTASATGTAAVDIAKFDVTVQGTKIAGASKSSTIASVSLFSSILDTALATETTGTKNGQGWAVADADVNQPGSGNKKFAPGTHGEFALSATNASDVTVDVEYAVAMSAVPAGVTIKYYAAAAATTAKPAAAKLFTTPALALADLGGDWATGKARLAKNGGTISGTPVLGWIWEYETGTASPWADVADTAAGEAATPATITATLTATATQVD